MCGSVLTYSLLKIFERILRLGKEINFYLKREILLDNENNPRLVWAIYCLMD